MKNKFLSSFLMLTIVSLLFGPINIVKADDKPNQATMQTTDNVDHHTGLIEATEKKNIMISQDIILDNSNIMSATQNIVLPNKVDNSTNQAFPEVVDQGNHGTCVSFATTYYQLSYMMNRAENRSSKNNENVYSPLWTYNLVNQGVDEGSEPFNNYSVLKELGANNIVDVSIDKKAQLLSNAFKDWHTNNDLWLKAQKNKIEDIYSLCLADNNTDTLITSNNDIDLDKIKMKLASGEIFAFSTYLDDWYVHTIQSNVQIPENNIHIGEPICDWVGAGSEGGHEMVIVGYDDDIWTDLNRDGQVQPGEKGAFKVVNSWGKNWSLISKNDDPVKSINWTSTDGFIWVAYDALNIVSSVPNNVYKGPRQRFILDDKAAVWGIKIKPIEEATNLYAKFTLGSTNRQDLKFTLSLSDNEVNDSSSDLNCMEFTPSFLKCDTEQDSKYNNETGAYTFSGTSSTDGTFYINLDNVIKNVELSDVLSHKWKLTVLDGNKEGNTTYIKDFRIVDGINGKEYCANIQTPISIDGNQISVYINPTIIKAPTSLIAINSNSGVSLKWKESYRAIGYRIYRNGNFLAETATNSYIDKEIVGDRTYEYEVKSKDNSDNYSLKSDKASVTIPANKVSISYYNTNNWNRVFIRYCIGNTTWTSPIEMKVSSNGTTVYQYNIDLKESKTVKVNFCNEKGEVDNNQGDQYSLNAGNYSISDGTIIYHEPVVLQLKDFNVQEVGESDQMSDRVGSQYKLQAEAIEESDDIQYRFTANKDGKITILQDYSLQKTTSWVPTESGDYKLYVEAKDTNGEVIRKEIKKVIKPKMFYLGNFIINSLTNDTTSDVNLYGYTVGAKGNVRYRYSVGKDNKTTIIQDYSINSTVTWKPSVAGEYTFKIEAMDESGRVVTQQKKVTINIGSKGPVIEHFTADVQSPQVIGTKIKLSANAEGKGNMQYKFVAEKDGKTLYIRDYNTTNMATWAPTGTGTYTLYFKAKDETGKEVVKTMSYVINDIVPKITETNTDLTSPQVTKEAIKLSTSVEKQGDFKYLFVAVKNGKTTFVSWYNKSNTTTWTPTETGTYVIYFKVKNSNGAVVQKTMNYVIKDKVDLVIKAYKTDLISPQSVGTAINLSTEAGGQELLKYAFVITKKNKTVHVSWYNTKKTAVWKPTEVGNYTIYFKVKDGNGKEVTKAMQYVVK